MLTETQDIQRADCVTRAYGPTVRATVYPAVLAPLPAYGTHLRGIALIDGDRASGLVIKLLNDLAGAGGAHLLSLDASTLMGRSIEWLTDVADSVRERRSDRVRGLVGSVSYLAFRFIQHPMLAPLQALPARRFGPARGC
jgi:hypothetical protein